MEQKPDNLDVAAAAQGGQQAAGDETGAGGGFKRRILIVSSEAVPPDSESPAAGCWRLAEELAGGHDVMLALPATTSYAHDDFVVLYYNDRNICLIAGGCDVVFCDADVLESHPALAEAEVPVITSLEVPPGGLTLPPSVKKSRGPLHYLRRFRYHMRTSGLWSMLFYSMSMLINRLMGRWRRRRP
ncbi:MAG: hypothetical protein AAB281_02255 [Actinomycetota bacterium]